MLEMTVKNTGMMIIDMQEKLLPVMDRKEEVLANTIKLLRGAMELGVVSCALRQYPKGLGDTIFSIQENYRGLFPTLDKTTFSGLGDREVADWVRGVDKKFMILCGVETHICVLYTAMDLISMGVTPVIACDCVSSRRREDSQAALSFLRSKGAWVLPLESILFGLLKDSKDPSFPYISKLIK